MNSCYFACDDCRVLVDAGYRWAASTLEMRGIVSRHARVSAANVLAAGEYWEPPRDEASRWLCVDVLPTVRRFLGSHATHNLRFGDDEEIMGAADAAFLDWLDVSSDPLLTPRHFVEVLRFSTWAQVVEGVKSRAVQPWWWSLDEVRDVVRVRFEDLVRTQQS